MVLWSILHHLYQSIFMEINSLDYQIILEISRSMNLHSMTMISRHSQIPSINSIVQRSIFMAILFRVCLIHSLRCRVYKFWIFLIMLLRICHQILVIWKISVRLTSLLMQLRGSPHLLESLHLSPISIFLTIVSALERIIQILFLRALESFDLSKLLISENNERL